VQLKQTELESAQLQLSQHQLIAPFAGRVVLVRGRVGEWVEVGAKVLRLVAVDKLRAEGFLPADRASADLVGKRVTLRVAEGKMLRGTLRFVSPEMEPVTRQVRVWAEISNVAAGPTGGLRNRAMNADPSYQLSAVDRPFVLRSRADVQQVPVRFSGQTAYVLKDPLTLELFHLTAEEFFLFDKLQQSMSLKELQQAFQHRFVPRQITPQQLQQGINQLYRQGLLLSESPGQGTTLRQRAARRKRTERWQSLRKVLSFRLGSLDVTHFVDGLYRRVCWVYSLPMLAIAIAVWAYALFILLGHGHEVALRLPSLAELAQPRYWFLWLTTVLVVKVIHELAHAVTCKHWGGRCHEMGVLLLAGIPCLYCDVTDVWRLPSKWQRIAVSAAGMIAELVLAAVALIAWWYTQPGVLHVWCLSVVVVCSVGTLLVNINPLLRYDGYYILSDLVEVPNLAGRAQGLLPTALRRWLLAEPRTADPMLSDRQRHGLLFYAVAARVYLTLVLLGIFVVLMTWARPFRLENLVITLGVITLAGMLFSPLMGVGRMMRNPSLRFGMRRPRLALLALAVSLLLAAFFLLPITKSVSGPAVFVPVEGQPIYATVAGELQFALAPGTMVQAGDVLARFKNPQSELAVARQQGEYEVRQVRYQQLRTMRTYSDRSSQELPTAWAAFQAAAVQLEELRSKADELKLRAPRAGMIVAPPLVFDDQHDQSRLPVWSGSPLEPRNIGCWVEPGTVLGMVADPGQLETLVAIDQADVAEVYPGQRVRILLESSPVRVLTGQVVQVAQRSAARRDFDSAMDAGKYHLVQVCLDSQDARLLIGTRGTAKIEARRSTLSAIVTNQLRQMFRLPW